MDVDEQPEISEEVGVRAVSFPSISADPAQNTHSNTIDAHFHCLQRWPEVCGRRWC